jgi:hypothetical protein
MGLFASIDRRRAATAAVALLIALGAGHFMQATVAGEEGVATLGDDPEAAPILKSGTNPRKLPVPPAATLTPIRVQPKALPERVTIDPRPNPYVPEDAAFSPYGLPCAPKMTVDLAGAAMLDVTISSPCRPDTKLTVEYADILLDGITNDFGLFTSSIPAMDSSFTVSATLEEGIHLRTDVEVSDASDFARVALIWEGPRVLSLHALEFGADYGDVGHIWSGAPKSPDRAIRGTGGFLTEFVGEQSSAEIYSFPIGHSPASGVVRLSVEAVVTSENCGREIHAMALQTGPLGGTVTREVALSMPDCESIGEIMQLKNLFQDMRLARQ